MLERSALKKAVLSVIRRHGQTHPIRGVDLFRRVTGETVIPARKHEQCRPIRSVIHELRLDGHPIAHTGGKHGGYYYCRDDSELAPTLRTLHSHAMSELQLEAALKRITFNELLHQYELEYDEQEVSD